MRFPWALAAVAPALALTLSAGAEPLHGRVQLQDVAALDAARSLAAQLAGRDRNDVLGDLRLTWTPRSGPWTLDTAYALQADSGDTPQLAAALDALGVFPPAPPATLFDWDDTLIDRRRLTATQRIDRLSLGYSSGHWVVRGGRQALTWGAGLVFRPMDLLDPFAPDATDTEYKPGTDMLYGQYLFDGGADVQGVIVPRPARRGGAVTADASSFALYARTSLASLQASTLLARDHGDAVAGFGLGGPAGGATWNAEIVPTFIRDGGTRVSALANISGAGRIGGRDASYFVEYFRNGFGLGSRRYSQADLPQALLDRLLRGQVFDTGRDYLAVGMQLQWTPLLRISPTVIANLDDHSLYLLGEADWSLEDDLDLIAGGQLPMGPSGTEFGGIPLQGAGPPTLGPPAKLYLQLRQYF